MRHNTLLKCPRCRRQLAYLTTGWAEDARHYEQKKCACGYKGQRKYLSLEMSNRLRERLSLSKEV